MSLQDIYSIDESLPCASKFDNMLGDLKLQAEALVLFADDVDGLLTCAIRPSIAFGPGNTEIIPFWANQAKPGWTKANSGPGQTQRTRFNLTKPAPDMMEDPFVKEISRLGNSKNSKGRGSSMSGGAFDDVDPLKGYSGNQAWCAF
ncbi:3beta-hydroxysteroid-4alpha-carboxylate 3-dehydrogenase [Sarracenia purpurea var. burkii]